MNCYAERNHPPSLKMTVPRFLLILSVHSNLVRAALVTRELRIASFAQQTFQIQENEFDPAEVWYKTKKVIAACLDIGRTQTREISGIAIVTKEAERVEWKIENQEIIARGKIVNDDSGSSPLSPDTRHGTLAMWLLWNLTGGSEISDARDFPKTHVRAPFDMAIPVVAMMRDADERAEMFDANVLDADRAVLGAARHAWKKVN